MNNGKKLWLSAILVLDFNSPDALKVLEGNYSGNQEIQVISYGSQDPEDRPSSCLRAKMGNYSPSELKQWAARQTPDPKAPIPLAESIRKIAFAAEFHLRKVDEVIIVSSGKDSCGQDPCSALRELSTVMSKKGQSVEITWLGERPACLKNEAPKKSVKVAPASVEETRVVLASALDPALKPAQTAQTLPSETRHAQRSARSSPTPSSLPSSRPTASRASAPSSQSRVTVKIPPPPLRYRFTPKEGQNRGKSVSATGGSSLRLPPGAWIVQITSPSWITQAPAVEWRLSPEENEFEARSLWKDSIDWVDPSDRQDMMLTFGEGESRQNILIPVGSPPVPVLKSARWKTEPVE